MSRYMINSLQEAAFLIAEAEFQLLVAQRQRKNAVLIMHVYDHVRLYWFIF